MRFNSVSCLFLLHNKYDLIREVDLVEIVQGCINFLRNIGSTVCVPYTSVINHMNLLMLLPLCISMNNPTLALLLDSLNPDVVHKRPGAAQDPKDLHCQLSSVTSGMIFITYAQTNQ